MIQRILLVSPQFHGYYTAVEKALKARGYDVATICYDKPTNAVGRIQNKLRHEGVRFVPDLATDMALAGLGWNPDLVLTIKGDLLGDRFWDALDDRGLPRVTWLYDEVRRMHWSVDGLRRAGLITSYSGDDVRDLTAEGVNAAYVPMAFDSTLRYSKRTLPAISFIGALYPNRRDYLVALHDAGVPVMAFGRDWSRHPVDILRTRARSRPRIPSGREVPRAEAYGLMAGSLASINVLHNQDGFPPRTFEVPGVGGVQLIDRPEVAEVYEPDSEVLVFRSSEELVELARRVIGDPSWTAALREAARRRTLAEHTFDHRIETLEQLWRSRL